MHANPSRALHAPRLWIATLIAVLVATLALPALAQRASRRPGLVVVIVVDQLRADYLTRYRDLYGNDGFARMMNSGAHFAHAYYSFGSASAAAGHATITTGRAPREHGIVADQWLQGQANPALKAAFFDPDVRIFVGPGGNTEGRSPRNLIGPTLGDQLKLSNRFSRVFSVALDDRAAIPMGGKRPDGAFWWDINTGQFVTSSYYMDELPAYVREFNNQRWADRFSNTRWDRLLPAAAYDMTYPLDPEWLTGTDGLGREFPHVLPRVVNQATRDYYMAVRASPFGNDVVLEMARRILVSERLGADDATDMLCVGLSSFDRAGHLFGPESPEMLDFAVRVDRQIAALLDLIDRAVGLNRSIVVLTADHGVTTAPRIAAAAGMGGGRVDLDAVIKGLNTRLSGIASLSGGRDYIYARELPWLYMDPAVAGLEPETQGRVLAVAEQTLRGTQGVADVFNSLALGGPAPARYQHQAYLAWRAYYPGRSGDLYVQLAPFWAGRGGDFAEHAGGSNHDRHVPIVIMGGGARPGRYFTEADPADISVTLAAMLGIEPPLGATGRVLHEAFDPTEFAR